MIFKILKFLIFPLALYLLVFSYYGKPYLVNINHTYQEPGYDQDGSSFIKNETVRSTLSGTFSRFTNNVQYPYGWSLVGIPMSSIIDNLVIFPATWFQGTSIFFWHNVGTIFVSLASSIFAFYLCYYITTSYIGSLLGGYVYAFSGLNLVYTGGNDPLTHFEFIPLFLLALFYYFDKKTPRSMVYVISAIVLNNLTSIYWGWFLYLTTAVIILTDYLVFGKYFSKISQIFKFFFVFLVCSGVLTVLLNLNFFYQSGRFIRAAESKKVSRAVTSKVFTGTELPQKYFLPSGLSLWQTKGNRFEMTKSYIPISIVIFILFLFSYYKKLTDKNKWFLIIGFTSVLFYVMLNTTSLQIPFRTIMPPIVAYSRTQILLNLFLGIFVAICISLVKKRKVMVVTAICLLVLLDTIVPKVLHITDLSKDTPRIVPYLASSYEGQGSILFYPWQCGRYGYLNLLFNIFHKWPIANPFFLPVDEKTKYLCADLNSYKSPNLKNYISLFDIRKIVAYPNSGLTFSFEDLEKNLSGCVSSQKTLDEVNTGRNSFDQFRNATVYDIDPSCRKKPLITGEDFAVESKLALIKEGDESKALNNYLHGQSDESMVFKKFSHLDENQYDLLKDIEFQNIKVSKVSDYEYNLEVPARKKGVVVTFNIPTMNLPSWKVYKIADINQKYRFFETHSKGGGFFFETNLHKTSLYLEPSAELETYKVVFVAEKIDKLLKQISDIGTVVFLLTILGFLVLDLKSRGNKTI